MTVKLEDARLDRFKRILEIANMSPAYCEEKSTIAEVVDKMVKSGHRRMPIVDKKRRLVGILTTSDVLDSLLKREDFKEKVSTIMVRDVVFCEVDDTIDFVLQKFKLSRRGGFPILAGEKIVGAISERDFVKRFDSISFGTKVEECMTRKPLYISPNVSIMDCLKSLVNTHYRRLPVVDEGKLVGITTTADMINYIHRSNYNFEAMDEPMDPVIIRDVCTIGKEEDVSAAIKMMKVRDVGGVLVAEGDRLEGIITERDILEEIE